jgi:hypothetical protein
MYLSSLMRRRRNPVEGRAPSRPWVQDGGHDGAWPSKLLTGSTHFCHI